MSLRPGRSYLIGEAKNRGGDGHREPPALPGGRGRELTGTEGGGEGECRSEELHGARGIAARLRGKEQTQETANSAERPCDPSTRRGGGGRVGSGVSPRHPSKRGRGRSAALPRTPAGTPEQRAKGKGGSKSCGGAAALPAPPRRCTGAQRGAGGQMAEQDGPQPPSRDTAETRREGKRLRRSAAPESEESRPSPDRPPPRQSPASGSQGRGARRGSGTS